MSRDDFFKTKGHFFLDFPEGFLAYQPVKEAKNPHALLTALYVKPEHKEQENDHCKKMLEYLSDVLQKEGLQNLLCAVQLADKDRDFELKRALDIGFNLANVEAGRILLYKKV
jgi:hypothetical protein